ncbi:MAG: ketoacyl-ACP synthase III [Candidatus Cloacimonetes bacterium]|nr:ketoacyl-ACP synthase III [Candidatus Cloacimonadota bacterium]
MNSRVKSESKYKAKISGTGRYLPEKIVNNYDFEKKIDTTDEWIRTRTGIFERRYAADNQATSDMAFEACLNALESAHMSSKDIDMIIVGTVTPDHPFPSTACILQKKLAIKGFGAFDISAGCPGWIYASDIARQYIENGSAENVMVVGADILTKITNFDDRGTCVLFGDAAGAVIMSRAERKDISLVIDSEIVADGSYYDILVQPAGGSRMPASEETVRKNLHTIYMEGNKVFKLAVKSMETACESVMQRNGFDIKSIDWLITHQANLRIIESLGNKLKVDPHKVIINIEKYANTSAATIPVALDEAVRDGKIRRGDVVLMSSFGAGLTSGSLLIRY